MQPAQASGGAATIDDDILGERAVDVDADSPLAVLAVLAEVLGAQTVGAGAAEVAVQAAHDAVAGGEGGDGGAQARDCAGALVRGRAGECRVEDARRHHEVRVAEGCDGDFDQ